MATSENPNSWHLSKSVSLSTMIAIAGNLMFAVWIFSSMDADIRTAKSRLDRVEAQVDEIKATAQNQAVQLSRIEAQIDNLVDKTDRILQVMERR